MTDLIWPGSRWDVVDPAAEGVDADMLDDAISGLAAREAREPRDMHGYLTSILATQTHRGIVGPLRDASGASGVVAHHGRVVGRWGDPSAVEMSFSATKTYLSAVAGLAFDRGMIPDLDEPVGASVPDGAFASARHARITWRHLLNQTSEWGGELWDRPYWSDPQGNQARDAPLAEPGAVWAYNDVRINLLALALTHRWRRPLDDVLRTELMDPIGCSETWSWHGYADAIVEIDGHRIPVVSGGAHWGGGLWADAWDHARFGHLFLRAGRWNDAQILSREWVDLAVTPCTELPSYGFLWWLNGTDDVFPGAPTTGFCARGNLGRQLVWIDPARDLVVVSRWADGVGSFLAAVSEAVG